MSKIVRSLAEANKIGACQPPISFKNKLLNGSFDIWQRGTSFTGQGYIADRWKWTYEDSGGATFSRIASTHPNFNYSLKKQLIQQEVILIVQEYNKV